jgi:membrane protease YdiL (CAAX protease family)
LSLTPLVAFLSEWLGMIAVAWLFSLSPRLKVPRIGFVYARRDGITALMLFGLILILAFVLAANAPLSGAPVIRLTPAPAPVALDQAPGVLQQALLAAALALAAFGIALVARQQPVRSIGWNPKLLVPALQMGLAMALLTLFLRNRVMDILAGLDAARWNLLLLAVGISLAEETIFRGYLQLRLSWWLGEWAGLALTAALFTLWHVPVWLRQPPSEPGWMALLVGLTFAQGLVLGWIMKTSKNVAAPALYRSISIWMNFLG